MLSVLSSKAQLGTDTNCAHRPARRREAPPQVGFQVRVVPSGHVRIILDYPSALPPSGLTDVRAIVCFPITFVTLVWRGGYPRPF